MEWSERHFPGRAEGIDARTVYGFGDSFGFHAGSYSGYGMWCNRLAHFAGFPSAEFVFENKPAGPFVELIDFADSEGVIGPVVSAKLARDFAEHESRVVEFANAMPSDGSWWLDKYRLWKKAFEMAADGGAVDFH